MGEMLQRRISPQISIIYVFRFKELFHTDWIQIHQYDIDHLITIFINIINLFKLHFM